MATKVSSSLRARATEYAKAHGLTFRDGRTNESALLRLALETLMQSDPAAAYVSNRIIAAQGALNKRLNEVFDTIRRDVIGMIREELGEDVRPESPAASVDDEDMFEDDGEEDEPTEERAVPGTTAPDRIEMPPMDETATLTGVHRRNRPAAPRKRR
jgi:hypothetical protein